MFIHFGVTAKRSTEVCLQKLPNSHNGMQTQDTIIMLGGSRVQALEVSYSNSQFARISIKLYMYISEVPLRSWNILFMYCLDIHTTFSWLKTFNLGSADTTFELLADKGRSEAASTGSTPINSVWHNSHCLFVFFVVVFWDQSSFLQPVSTLTLNGQVVWVHHKVLGCRFSISRIVMESSHPWPNFIVRVVLLGPRQVLPLDYV